MRSRIQPSLTGNFKILRRVISIKNSTVSRHKLIMRHMARFFSMTTTSRNVAQNPQFKALVKALDRRAPTTSRTLLDKNIDALFVEVKGRIQAVANRINMMAVTIG